MTPCTCFCIFIVEKDMAGDVVTLEHVTVTVSLCFINIEIYCFPDDMIPDHPISGCT